MALLNKIGQVLTTDLNKDFKSKMKEIVADDSKTLVQQMQQRRSIYALGKKVSLSQKEITQLIQDAMACCPSALNSRSARIIILFDNAHQQFWEIVKEKQRPLVPSHVFAGFAMKIEQCADALGTVLFYEDQSVIGQLQKQIPLQAEYFPQWSEQTSGMAQFAVWTALADAGLGACLQHYNSLIHEQVTQLFELPMSWQLKAQLVFGSIEAPAVEKEPMDKEICFRVFH